MYVHDKQEVGFQYFVTLCKNDKLYGLISCMA